MATTDDQLSELLGKNADLFAAYEAWSNGQIMLLAGTIDDPDSFDAEGAKSGPLGYYPIVNVSGQTLYVPSMARLRALALGGENDAAFEALIAQVQPKIAGIDAAIDAATVATQGAQGVVDQQTETLGNITAQADLAALQAAKLAGAVTDTREVAAILASAIADPAQIGTGLPVVQTLESSVGGGILSMTYADGTVIPTPGYVIQPQDDGSILVHSGSASGGMRLTPDGRVSLASTNIAGLAVDLVPYIFGALSIVLNDVGDIASYVALDGTTVDGTTLPADANSATVIAGVTVKTAYTPGALATIEDAFGNISAYIAEDFTMVGYGSDQPQASSSGAAIPTSVTYSYDSATGLTFPFDSNVIFMFLVTGQSYPAAETIALDDVPYSTTALHPGYSLMPDVGPFPDGREFTTFADLREILYSVNSTNNSCETPCSRFAGTIQDRLQAAFGRKQQILMAVAAHGGTPYVGIKRGTATGTEALRLVSKCNAIATSMGKRLIVNELMMHGENDTGLFTPTAQYADYLIQSRQYLEEDVRKITGQPEPLRQFVYQVLRGSIVAGNSQWDPYYIPTVGLGQKLAAERDPYITCVGPIYWAPENPNDTSHLSVIGRAQLGEHFADVVCRELWGSTFAPLEMVEAYRISDTNIRVVYNRDAVSDTSGTIVNISTLPGFGFELVDGVPGPADASTLRPPVFSAITAVPGQSKMIDLTLANPSAGRRSILQYGARRTTQYAGNQGGARGCVREPTAYMTSVTGTPLYHWAAVQRLPIL